tara:strand:- start:5240 stop:5686 length:447 start_codon:yes stop_codon:yes gene_type:complete
MNKSEWDDYFMDIAKTISKRSPDPSTKHGCVIVDRDKRIISTGYNGPVHNINDTLIDWTRPAKYLWIIHAEENAVLFATQSLKGCTAYVTGEPCSACFRRFCQMGFDRVVFGSIVSKCINKTEQEFNQNLANLCNVILEFKESPTDKN